MRLILRELSNFRNLVIYLGSLMILFKVLLLDINLMSYNGCKNLHLIMIKDVTNLLLIALFIISFACCDY